MTNPAEGTVVEITKQLPPLLGVEVSQVKSAVPEGSSLPGTVLKVCVVDKRQREYPLILKREESDVSYRLYQHYLEPYHLNSPKEYGYIEIAGQRFLVMDYVGHLPTAWEDRAAHMKAIKWLVKKDLITQQNMDSVRKLDCLGIMPYYGMDYWMSEFEEWYKNSKSSSQAKDVWMCVNANRNRVNEYIDELNEEGMQTVVHGDLYLDNILLSEDESNHELFVIDWTQPHISSVTKDLVGLYDTAPDDLKREIIETYRKQIDFPQFDVLFAKAKVLRDIGYLSWMAWMIVEQQEEIPQNELDPVATSLMMALGNS